MYFRVLGSTHGLDGDDPACLGANAGKARFLAPQVLQSAHVTQRALLHHRHREVRAETSWQHTQTNLYFLIPFFPLTAITQKYLWNTTFVWFLKALTQGHIRCRFVMLELRNVFILIISNYFKFTNLHRLHVNIQKVSNGIVLDV